MLFFWGWGRRNKGQQLPDGRHLQLSYAYAHFMFLFQVAWGFRYALGTPTPSGLAWLPIQPTDAQALNGGAKLVPNPWVRYSILVPVAVVVVIVIAVVAGG